MPLDDRSADKARRSQKKAPVRIFLVDDHPLLREGLARRINGEKDLTVCGEAGDVGKALQAIRKLKPDLVVVDISMPGRDGIDLIKDIKVRFPGLLVLVLSLHDESLYAERSLRAGARGYVMKSAPPEEFLRAIRRVLAGEIAIGQGVASRLLSLMADTGRQGRKSPLETLTDRELEVLLLLGRGRQRGEIAEELHLSVKTIEAHRANMRLKLGLRSASELRMYAIEFLREEEARPSS